MFIQGESTCAGVCARMNFMLGRGMDKFIRWQPIPVHKYSAQHWEAVLTPWEPLVTDSGLRACPKHSCFPQAKGLGFNSDPVQSSLSLAGTALSLAAGTPPQRARQ